MAKGFLADLLHGRTLCRISEGASLAGTFSVSGRSLANGNAEAVRPLPKHPLILDPLPRSALSSRASPPLFCNSHPREIGSHSYFSRCTPSCNLRSVPCNRLTAFREGIVLRRELRILVHSVEITWEDYAGTAKSLWVSEAHSYLESEGGRSRQPCSRAKALAIVGG